MTSVPLATIPDAVLLTPVPAVAGTAQAARDDSGRGRRPGHLEVADLVRLLNQRNRTDDESSVLDTVLIPAADESHHRVAHGDVLHVRRDRTTDRRIDHRMQSHLTGDAHEHVGDVAPVRVDVDASARYADQRRLRRGQRWRSAGG
jgi:hypothetical protein